MFKKVGKNSGFTLIEVLVAMTIFVAFTSVIISSYTSIVRSQKEANDYRILYSEARNIFDKLTDEIRNSTIFYYTKFDNARADEPVRAISGSDELLLISKDGKDINKFYYEDGNGKLCFVEGEKAYYLNSDNVQISNMHFFVSPVKDPYAMDNSSKENLQFQPKVTVFARFSKELSGGNLFEADFQTTVSSRYYSAVDTYQLEMPTTYCTGENSLSELDLENL